MTTYERNRDRVLAYLKDLGYPSEAYMSADIRTMAGWGRKPNLVARRLGAKAVTLESSVGELVAYHRSQVVLTEPEAKPETQIVIRRKGRPAGRTPAERDLDLDDVV